MNNTPEPAVLDQRQDLMETIVAYFRRGVEPEHAILEKVRVLAKGMGLAGPVASTRNRPDALDSASCAGR